MHTFLNTVISIFIVIVDMSMDSYLEYYNINYFIYVIHK